MSIRYVSLLLAVGLLISGPASAISIRVFPGGIPLGSAQQLMDEGMRLGNTQMLRQAWDAYEKAVKLDPNSSQGYLGMGRIFFYLSMLDAAGPEDVSRAQKLAEVASTGNLAPGDVHYLLGMVLSGKGAYLDAVDELKLALYFNPGNEFILCDLASIHLTLHQSDAIIELLEGKNLRSGWAYLNLAMAWLQKGEKGKAWLNLVKAQKLGYTGYWLEKTKTLIQKDLLINVK